MALFDVVLGYDCNVACTYCTITPEMRLRGLPTAQVAASIDRAAAKGYRDIAFTGGEPTIRPDLAALVRHAKRRGFDHVKVSSNGLRYADGAYLDHLLAAGVDQVNVSLHAFGDEAYEDTVRRAGTAPLLARALENLRARGIAWIADLIVKEDTYRQIVPWIDDLHGKGARRFALWLVSLTDQNAAHPEQLPRLSDVAPFAVAAFERARREGFEVVALHVPRCFVPGYEDHVRHPGADKVSVLTPDDAFELANSRLTGGVKPPACARCVHAPVCPGLRRDYVARHGDAEIRPVLAPGEPTA